MRAHPGYPLYLLGAMQLEPGPTSRPHRPGRRHRGAGRSGLRLSAAHHGIAEAGPGRRRRSRLVPAVLVFRPHPLRRDAHDRVPRPPPGGPEHAGPTERDPCRDRRRRCDRAPHLPKAQQYSSDPPAIAFVPRTRCRRSRWPSARSSRRPRSCCFRGRSATVQNDQVCAAQHDEWLEPLSGNGFAFGWGHRWPPCGERLRHGRQGTEPRGDPGGEELENAADRDARYRSEAIDVWREQPIATAGFAAAKVLHTLGFSLRDVETWHSPWSRLRPVSEWSCSPAGANTSSGLPSMP